MTKKRQQDFAKVQLKPGRLLGKRRNITAANFKAKKIIMPKEKLTKEKPKFTIQDSIHKIVTAGNDKSKALKMNELIKMIRQSDALAEHLPHIFEGVLHYLRDSSDDIRNAALKVITTVLSNTDDSQLYGYTDLLNNTISAVMKNPTPKIASTALILIDCMLKNHPDLICHNANILYDLIPNVRKHYTRKVSTEKKETYQYSEREDINALGHINAFLKVMLKDKSDVIKNEEDGNVVYMGSNDELYLDIYAGGGLQPIDIEEARLRQLAPQTNDLEKKNKLESLIDHMLKLIPNYFRQVLVNASNDDDNTFRCEPISDLNILIQLLCNVTELAEEISCTVDEEVAAFLKESIFSTQRKRFPFELHSSNLGTSLLSLAMLNASVCFLFMKFLSLGDNSESDEELMEKYVKRFFCYEKAYNSQIKCECIPLFIKTIKLFNYKTHVPKVIDHILEQLVNLLKTRVNHPDKKVLIEFLFTMSLSPEYKFWIDSKAMDLWYEWLFSHFKENMSRLDKKMIKMILKIAKLRHSSFLKYLDFSVIKSLLNRNDNNLKEDAIVLLHNMDIDGELLKDVYDIISQDCFPKDYVIKAIHMLHVRFVQYPADEDVFVDYVVFLLNVAVDVYNISSSRLTNFEANKYAKALESLHGTHSFNIIPNLYWKQHSKVFDVCQTYLRSLSSKAVGFIQMKFIKQLLLDQRMHFASKSFHEDLETDEEMESIVSLPMHCTLAILKLQTFEIKEKKYDFLMRDLSFSCFLTVSVLMPMRMQMEDEWFKWNAAALNNSLSLTERTVEDILLIIKAQINFRKPTGLFVYHTLRVFKFLVEKRVWNEAATFPQAHQIMMYWKDCCYDSCISKQPLFIKLKDYFTSHFCD